MEENKNTARLFHVEIAQGIYLISDPEQGPTEDGFSLVEEKDTVTQTVEDECSHVCRRFDLQIFQFALCVVFKEDYRILQAFLHHLVYQGALFSQSVGMIALRNQYDFRMIL